MPGGPVRKTEPPQQHAGATMKISWSDHWAILALNTSTKIRLHRGHFGDQREPLEHFTRGIAHATINRQSSV